MTIAPSLQKLIDSLPDAASKSAALQLHSDILIAKAIMEVTHLDPNAHRPSVITLAVEIGNERRRQETTCIETTVSAYSQGL